LNTPITGHPIPPFPPCLLRFLTVHGLLGQDF